MKPFASFLADRQAVEVAALIEQAGVDPNWLNETVTALARHLARHDALTPATLETVLVNELTGLPQYSGIQSVQPGTQAYPKKFVAPPQMGPTIAGAPTAGFTPPPAAPTAPAAPAAPAAPVAQPATGPEETPDPVAGPAAKQSLWNRLRGVGANIGGAARNVYGAARGEMPQSLAHARIQSYGGAAMKGLDQLRANLLGDPSTAQMLGGRPVGVPLNSNMSFADVLGAVGNALRNTLAGHKQAVTANRTAHW